MNSSLLLPLMLLLLLNCCCRVYDDASTCTPLISSD
jgi:hypothetical protein